MKKSSRRVAPKQLRAVQTSRHWRVAPHRHTGHLTHRRSTSYPALAMIVLCVGVFLASWTRFVVADPFVYPGPISNDYAVHASVPGPPPTVAPTIDSPLDGTKTDNPLINVSGSCPLNTYVTLYRNGAFSGVALCQADGTWQLQSGLFPGVNQLRARVFSPTDVGGPFSSVVSVTYTPVVPHASSGNQSSGATGGNSGTTSGGQRNQAANPAYEPLIFKTIYRYEGHYIGQSSGWQLAIEGGTAPYAISVDWGDGSHDLISRVRAGSFNLDHIYKKPGAYKGSYVVKFSATDSEGAQAFLQLMTIVNNPPGGAGVSGRSDTTGSMPDYLSPLLKYIWPGYAIVVLMLLSFWLGERREYYYLKPRLKRVRHA